MQKRWVETAEAEQKVIDDLQGCLKVDAVLATLLAKRGVTCFDDAKYYFRPDLSQLHDPFLMADMERAILRIEKAVNTGERVLIYGDYDVDGTTSVALAYSFFRKYIRNINFYIPDRYKEGYGISTAGIDYAATHNYTLIIALDCGIKSVEAINYASSLGVDFIICDHHNPGEILPAACAVLDPKRRDCTYPYKELSGCGIGFKLVQAYAIKNDIAFEEISCYLDLVAVSIASDIVPITGENRIMAWYGLKKLNTDPCNGLAALIEVAGKKENYTISDIVFMIGPRINAAGRIDDAKHAVNLLIAEDKATARDKGALINLKNIERKEHDVSITEQALAMLDSDSSQLKRKTTVLYNENWHKGVIGIVASRLTEKYYRPTVVLTQSNDYIAGSARSVTGFDLYEALSSCSDLLDQFGGHKYAAGLTMKAENVVAFQQRFEEVVSDTIPDELLIQEISIDACLQLKNLDAKFFRILHQFSPFGPGNMSPVFLSKNVYVNGNVSVVGNNHIKMSIMQEGSPAFECIGFGLGDNLPHIQKGIPFDICYTVEENLWKDKKTIQLNIKGIRSVKASVVS